MRERAGGGGREREREGERGMGRHMATAANWKPRSPAHTVVFPWFQVHCLPRLVSHVGHQHIDRQQRTVLCFSCLVVGDGMECVL